MLLALRVTFLEKLERGQVDCVRTQTGLCVAQASFVACEVE